MARNNRTRAASLRPEDTPKSRILVPTPEEDVLFPPFSSWAQAWEWRRRFTFAFEEVMLRGLLKTSLRRRGMEKAAAESKSLYLLLVAALLLMEGVAAQTPR